MSTENTVGMSYVKVDNVKWEAPTPVVKEIERLQAELKQANAVVEAAREMAGDYEAYESRGDWRGTYDVPVHDVEILKKWEEALDALEVIEDE